MLSQSRGTHKEENIMTLCHHCASFTHVGSQISSEETLRVYLTHTESSSLNGGITIKRIQKKDKKLLLQ